jgi:hypothetical protein
MSSQFRSERDVLRPGPILFVTAKLPAHTRQLVTVQIDYLATEIGISRHGWREFLTDAVSASSPLLPLFDENRRLCQGRKLLPRILLVTDTKICSGGRYVCVCVCGGGGDKANKSGNLQSVLRHPVITSKIRTFGIFLSDDLEKYRIQKV